MKKTCSACKTEKDLSDFRRDRTQPCGYQSHCKICARDRINTRYLDKYKPLVRERTERTRLENNVRVEQYKLANPCCKCGEADPICLEFHHVDPAQKDFSIGENRQRNWNKLLEEIKKCIVLCSNCHKKIHGGKLK